MQSFTKICQKILIAILAKHDLQENVSDTFLQISQKTNIKNSKFSKDHFYKEVRKRRPSRGLQIS